MKLKIRLLRIENTLFYRVLEQDESLRGKEIIYEKDGFYVMSVVSLAMEKDGLYIRGSEELFDGNWCHYNFPSKEECDAYIEKVKTALLEINGGPKELAKVEVVIKKKGGINELYFRSDHRKHTYGSDYCAAGSRRKRGGRGRR